MEKTLLLALVLAATVRLAVKSAFHLATAVVGQALATVPNWIPETEKTRLAALALAATAKLVPESALRTLKTPPSLQDRARTRLPVMGTVQQQTPPPMASLTTELLILARILTSLPDRLQQLLVVLPMAFMDKESLTLAMAMTKLLPPVP
jgi:hypothetical protein